MSILAVPWEIRQAVYPHLLISKEGLKPWEYGVRRSCRIQHSHHVAILRTCRQIYDEAYPFLLSNNVFVHQTVFDCTSTTYSLSGDNNIYPRQLSYELEKYQTPCLPLPLSHFVRLDLIRHLELKSSNGFDCYDFMDSLQCVAHGCLLRTLRLEFWCDWGQDRPAELLDALMRLEVSEMISITVMGRAPGQSDMTIKIMDRMLASGKDGWRYDVESANLDAGKDDTYPFLPRHDSQVGEWVLVPRKKRAIDGSTNLYNAQ